MRCNATARRLADLTAAALATSMLLAGCAPSGGGRPATRAEADNGVAAKTAEQVVADMRQAVRGARSFHVTGSTSEAGQTVRLDMRLTRDGGAKGSISLDGVTAELLADGGKVYLRGERFWQRFGGEVAAQLIGDRWVSLPTSGAGLADLTALTSQATFVDQLEPEGTVSKGGTRTVGGRPALALVDGKDGSTLYVATTGKPYPLRIESKAPTDGTVTFDRFDEPLSIAAPADPVDFSSLRSD